MQGPRRSAADVVWRYRFRRKWRREQLRALLGAPFNPDNQNFFWQLLSGSRNQADHAPGAMCVMRWLKRGESAATSA